MKTLAVISDIHGNSLALAAVLADIEQEGGVDCFINLGDLAVFGPDPTGVLILLNTLDPIIHLAGNTDRYLIEKQYPGTPGGSDWESQVLASFPWTAAQLGSRGLQFFVNFPSQRLIQFSSNHAILAVHGSPRSDEENMKPDTPEAELATMMPTNQSYNLLLCAHTHLPFDRVVAGRRVVNVGSVGLPFDGDPRASYAKITLQPDGEYLVELRRVAYDIERVVDQLYRVNHPTAEISAYNLRTARPLGQGLIYTDDMRQGKRQKPLQADLTRRTGGTPDTFMVSPTSCLMVN